MTLKILPINLAEGVRSRLCLSLGIINWLLILASLALVGVGTYIKLSVEQFTNLVENYDGDTLTLMLISVGIISLLINCFGGFVCFAMTSPAKRETYRPFMIAYLVLGILVCICVLAGGIMCYTHITHLHASFDGGLLRAMNKYQDPNHRHLKEEMDMLQMNFQCCGNDEYTDWFHIQWVHDDYLVQKMAKAKNGAYNVDDVPFSCCDPKSLRPCVHHHVHDNSRHYNYDYRQQVTIQTIGCRDALMDYFGGILLTQAGACVLIIFAIQLIILLIGRYLQTSVMEALDQNCPTKTTQGYLLAIMGTGDKDNDEEEKDVKLVAEHEADGGWQSDEFDDVAAPLVPSQSLSSRPHPLSSQTAVANSAAQLATPSAHRHSRMSTRLSRNFASSQHQYLPVPAAISSSTHYENLAAFSRQPSQSYERAIPYAPSLPPSRPNLPPSAHPGYDPETNTYSYGYN